MLTKSKTLDLKRFFLPPLFSLLFICLFSPFLTFILVYIHIIRSYFVYLAKVQFPKLLFSQTSSSLLIISCPTFVIRGKCNKERNCWNNWNYFLVKLCKYILNIKHNEYVRDISITSSCVKLVELFDLIFYNGLI